MKIYFGGADDRTKFHITRLIQTTPKKPHG